MSEYFDLIFVSSVGLAFVFLAGATASRDWLPGKQMFSWLGVLFLVAPLLLWGMNSAIRPNGLFFVILAMALVLHGVWLRWLFQK